MRDDIPSPIDFHDMAEARAWVENTARLRPWRPAFFAAFAAALKGHFGRPFTVLELGSGPGQLAEQILRQCDVSHYTALDFSDAMHRIAREKLAAWPDRVTTLTRDFREAAWPDGLGSFDAVVTLQAAHETRHRRHLAPFLSRAHGLMARGGLMLYCDHYLNPDMTSELYIAREEQIPALEQAGFHAVRRLHDEGGMALYAAEA
jgi:cyclopropane fatty-acyl-phospholipid synthase-like methyltransferase